MFDLATPEGTRRYTDRFSTSCAPGHFRTLPVQGGSNLLISSIGMGSYTGPVTDEADAQYTAALVAAVRRGINLIDCAINYRHMRSERALGEGLRKLFESGEAARDELCVMSKGGYLPLDGRVPPNTGAYFRHTYLDTGIIQRAELVANSHCIAPRFLEDQIGRSLHNFGLQALDIYFLHNVEQQLDEVSQEEFERRMEAAFAYLESAVESGRIGLYGVATWNGFRVPPDAPGHLSLERLVEIAQKAGGEGHHFCALQLPYNLGMLEGLNMSTQTLQGSLVPLLEAAAHFGLMVVTSVPLLQTQVLPHVPAEFARAMPNLTTQAQRALQFVRSTPGVFAPLVGMRNPSHVDENAALCAVPPLGEAQFYRLLGG